MSLIVQIAKHFIYGAMVWTHRLLAGSGYLEKNEHLTLAHIWHFLHISLWKDLLSVTIFIKGRYVGVRELDDAG